MDYRVCLALLSLLFTKLLPLVLCQTIDPFDMRDYDRKTKTMKSTSNMLSLVDQDQQQCADCLRFIQEYCETSVANELQTHPSVAMKASDVPHDEMFRTHMMRLINVLLNKSGFKESKKGSKDQESLLSVKLSPNQVSILKDFGRSGNPAVLRDVNDILSAQVTSYYPPICADDMFQKIYGAKEFFSQSTLIILGIIFMAGAFFYNVFVLKQIRLAFLCLLATIFFTGYFWTYWKLYEEVMSDIRRITTHHDMSDCIPRTETFWWFFTYTTPADDRKCKELYDAKHITPLSRLTPTIVFFETIKIFWTGPMSEIASVTVSLYKELSYYAPWYIKWTVLPIVFIFVGVIFILLAALLSGKRFKLSHPIFGAIDLGNDVSYQQQTSITKSETAFKVVKCEDGSDPKLSCLTCGASWSQTAAVITTRTVVEGNVKTDSVDGAPIGISTGTGLITVLQNMSRFLLRQQRPIREVALLPVRPCIKSKPDGETIFTNEGLQSLTEDQTNLVTLEDCSDSDGEDKENRITITSNAAFNNLPENDEPIMRCSRQQNNIVLNADNRVLSAPLPSTSLGPKQKFFDNIKFTRSPDPQEKKLIPILVQPRIPKEGSGEPFASCGGSGEPSPVRVASPLGETLRHNDGYFAESNRRIRKELRFRHMSAKLYSPPSKDDIKVVESVFLSKCRKEEKKRKLSI